VADPVEPPKASWVFDGVRTAVGVLLGTPMRRRTPLVEPPDVVRRISVPAQWYLGAHGDPIAQFDYLILILMADGSVRWERDQ